MARHCLDCGYALDRLIAERCPECGRTFDPDDAATFSRRPRRLLAPAVAYLIGIPLIAPVLFVIYLQCFEMTFDNPAAPLPAQLIVWILSFPLVYLILVAEWAFTGLLVANVVLWSFALVTAGHLVLPRRRKRL